MMDIRLVASLGQIHEMNDTLPKHILIVNDDAGSLRMYEIILSRSGLKCSIAQDVPQALDLLEQYDFDLIFTDIFMPGINGLEFTKMLREREETRETPIVTTSSHPTEFVLTAYEAGANDHINIPIMPTELVKRINQQLFPSP